MKLINSKKIFLSIITLWGVGLAGLSIHSHYHIIQSVGIINFDIATLLTPYGMAKNLNPSSDLFMYYFYKTSARANIFSNVYLILHYLLIATSSLAILFYLKANKK